MSFQGQRGVDTLTRFHTKYVEAPNGCWEWTDALDEDGYGVFWDGAKQRKIPAHRYALESVHGPLGKLRACHTCDNPRCVNPAHLFPGTDSDNMWDKAIKGRTKGFAAMKGESHTQAKLTTAEVKEIKVRLALGEKQKIIAEDYGVKDSLISRINTGKIWKDVVI